MKRAFMVGAIGLTLAGGVQAEAPTTATRAATRAATRERLTQGRAVYNFRCYYCHGYSGNARTLAATFLTPAPADFTRASPERLTAAAIAETVRQGRAGTAMKPFASVISAAEIEAVSAFVHDEFVTRKAENTRYHTTENGWPNHDRYRLAFPFATGEIPLSQPWESLTPEQSVGKRLYLDSCVSCHDRGAAGSDGPAWDSRPLSYPRNNFSLADPPVDATASASPYLKHEIPPKIRAMTATERRGEKLFQKNCAFCHGADGTGKNWIGSFMEPHPRNLTDPNFMSAMTRARLESAIREGLKDTSMPAWKAVLDAQQIRAIVAYINRAFHRLAD